MSLLAALNGSRRFGRIGAKTSVGLPTRPRNSNLVEAASSMSSHSKEPDYRPLRPASGHHAAAAGRALLCANG